MTVTYDYTEKEILNKTQNRTKITSTLFIQKWKLNRNRKPVPVLKHWKH